MCNNDLVSKTGLYGTCSTSASTAQKDVILNGFQLVNGAQVTVYFSNRNTNSSPTLNVNSTGAKSIKILRAGSKYTYYAIGNGPTRFTYDGTDWLVDSIGNLITYGGSYYGRLDFSLSGTTLTITPYQYAN